MGRYPLLILLGLGGVACSGDARPAVSGTDPHGTLACVECHQGGLSDRELASVPSASCTASDCHAGGVSREVTLATVRFEHRGHGSTGTPTPGCAGCHSHSSGDEPLTAGTQACGLCHADELSGARPEDCRLCHADLNHRGMTSQGVSVPHEGLPWIEGGCLRCHYAVTRPVHEVSLARCAACHGDVEAVTEAGIGEDLHPIHSGNSCAACHEEDNHRIEAMSSAVELQCGHCHSVEHDVEVAEGVVSPSTCDTCHQDAHQGPQTLLLGVLPGAEATVPSDHFMDGLTCRSCHLSDQGRVAGRQEGTSDACVACHRPEYATVLRWWTQGIAERLSLVDRYVTGAERAVQGRTADDPAVTAVATARSRLNLVRDAGGQHNLPLTHKVFEDAVAAASEAYQRAGRGVPTPPQLGRAPRQGICAYCHYRLDEPGFSETMDDAFHRSVVGAR